MAAVELDLSGPERKLKELGRALRAVEEGKVLRKQLLKEIRAAAGPARQDVRAAIRSLASQGHPGRSIRSAIAQKVQITAKVSGRTVGARLVVKTTGTVRDFPNAPRRFNSAKGWDHPAWGGKNVHQVGKPGWFDDTLKGRRREFRDAVIKAMDATAQEVARRIR